MYADVYSLILVFHFIYVHNISIKEMVAEIKSLAINTPKMCVNNEWSIFSRFQIWLYNIQKCYNTFRDLVFCIR